MFKGAKKEDLRRIASELELCVSDKLTVLDLMDLIKNCDRYKNDPDSVHELANLIIEERKYDESQQLELEKIREKSKLDLEIARIRANDKDNNTEVNCNDSPPPFSVDSLIKREKAANIIIYLNDEDLKNYDKIKSIILQEFEPTPQSCLENFKKATRQNCESHVQFASRLTTNWEYYLKLRNVSNFEVLKQLIVSDKIFSTLDKETASHISVRQADKWFDPLTLGKEIDLFYSSRGKPLSENINYCRKNQNSKNMSKVFFSDVKGKKCVLCQSDSHVLNKCPQYKQLSVNKRVKLVKNNSLCFNCLNLHRVKFCKSKVLCKCCQKKHHSSLCFSGDPNFTSERVIQPSSLGAERTGNRGILDESTFSEGVCVQTHKLHRGDFERGVFSGCRRSVYCNELRKIEIRFTFNAICFIRDSFGKMQEVGALLDGGSTSNFISQQCMNRLNLKREKINILVSGLNNSELTIKSRVNATIANRGNSYETNADFFVVPRITDMIPSQPFNISLGNFSREKLADENFNIPGNIDLLLGAEIFYEILLPGQTNLLNTKLIFQNTVFGYIASGSIPVSSENKPHCGLIKDNVDLEKTMRRFWEIENVEPETIKNKETIICEEHFQKNHTRDSTGRYIVSMPFKKDPSCLGQSKDIALKKLNSLWNRLKREPNYLKLYRDFLKEYKELDHRQEVDEREECRMYFIPHLGVRRSDKKTTSKLRVVFNASSATTNGYSLNSLQYNGGVAQNDLYSIMVRFRKHIFAFIADMQKMYQMISINPDQRKLQRILWRENIDEPIKTFELSTVTYGTTSAPFLATRTLKQLALDEAGKFPLGFSVVMSDMYIDDVLTGAETLLEAKELKNQLINIFVKGGMVLHKWCGNNTELIEVSENYDFSDSSEIKVLGVYWNPKHDCFSFRVKIDLHELNTKRDVLSTIARIYDPLGLLVPVVAKAKIFLQKLWMLKIDWTDLLPDTINREWRQFVESLQVVNDININRCIVVEQPEVIELHGFSDASQSAYGAVVYCKSITSDRKMLVHLIASKSRVAPTKQIMISRLELCAAVLLAKLVHRVKQALKLNVTNTFLWSDFMIVLS
ncbi:integrase catalytic domain-containing protein [Trichonephila clavipes]|nr:integrase catalytic domain-containing protein [Trichonephila clavipes]